MQLLAENQTAVVRVTRDVAKCRVGKLLGGEARSWRTDHLIWLDPALLDNRCQGWVRSHETGRYL